MQPFQPIIAVLLVQGARWPQQSNYTFHILVLFEGCFVVSGLQVFWVLLSFVVDALPLRRAAQSCEKRKERKRQRNRYARHCGGGRNDV